MLGFRERKSDSRGDGEDTGNLDEWDLTLADGRVSRTGWMMCFLIVLTLCTQRWAEQLIGTSNNGNKLRGDASFSNIIIGNSRQLETNTCDILC